MNHSSRISGFYKLGLRERIKKVKEFANLTKKEEEMLETCDAFSSKQADKMVENVSGTFTLPYGVAVNFLINDKDYLIPMVIEESSVIAAASFGAKLIREGGGFFTSYTGSIMRGQIQAVNVSDPSRAKMDILSSKDKIIDVANNQDPMLVDVGGGAKDLEVKILGETPKGTMLITHLLVDTKDAMGANAVNTMCEAVAPLIEEITGGRVYLRILSNLADTRLARAKCRVPKKALEFKSFEGEEVVEGILEAYAFARGDPYRAATHNKGIMNGIDAVVIATGNDWRAIEAGAHAYAARSGHYGPLTVWEKDQQGNLAGSIEIPIAIGTIGGATKVHPLAKVTLKILGVESARELAEVMAAVGLAQNFAALRALATEGIQSGHMKLHAKNVAVSAGATGELIDKVARRMIEKEEIKLDKARELIEELSNQK